MLNFFLQIQIIDSSIFKWTRGLRELSFSRNDVVGVSDTSFANLTGLRLLDLSHNRSVYVLEIRLECWKAIFSPLMFYINVLHVYS